MKRLFLGGLALLLGCLVSRLHAEELKWRPAGAGGGSSAARTPDASKDYQIISLRRPAEVAPATLPAMDQKVLPVKYYEAGADPFQLTAKNGQEALNPLPPGPAGGEPIPMPKQPEKVQIHAKPRPATSALPHYPTVPGIVPDGAIVTDEHGNPMTANWGGETLDCDPCWTDCCFCCLPRFWARAEYLAWATRGTDLPPLVTGTTLSPAELVALRAANPAFRPGAIGQTGTQLLFGTGDEDFPAFNGGRFTLGIGNLIHHCGLEATYFFLAQRSDDFSAASGGQPGLYRPFFNVTNPPQDAQQVAFPGVLAGGVNVNQTQEWWGGEFNFRKPWWCGCNYRVDLLAGFRYLEVEEALTIQESVTFLVAAPGIGIGDNIRVTDSFETRNQFYGGQIGADFEYRLGRWLFGVTGKVALGNVHQTVNINGSTIFTPAGGAPVTAQGGLLAQSTNIGRYSQDRFAVVPEVGLKIGYQLTDNLSVYAGYNFLYISDVVRPADQIDLAVNTTQVPTINSRLGGGGALVGPARPAFLFRNTDHWAQGFDFGLELRY